MLANTKKLQAFRSQFDCDPPIGLLELLCDQTIIDSLPATFSLAGIGHSIEIQHLLDIHDPLNLRFCEGKLAFAVTTDGYNLLVDLKSASTFIFQEEFGSIDSLGILLQDLLLAQHSPLK